MSGTKDHGIRLFGRTIQLAQNDDVSAADCEQSFDHIFSCSNRSVSPQSLLYKNPTHEGDSMDSLLEHVSSNSILESNNEDQAKSSTEEQEKPLKKPTKIIPCPRCESRETKFCYFNNYNANQPRHFCKNCQRYWTAGGSMRNMPVGAGRRKNKTNPHPIVIPNAFQSRQDSTMENSSHHEAFAPQVHGFSGPLWASPWNPAHASSSMPPHAFLPLPIYAGPPYWNMRWIHQASDSASLRPSTPLGKHPRDANKLKASNKEHHGHEKTTESKVLVPKTLRFDDPSEAAKSSIWTTLGMKAHKSSGCYDSSAFFGRFPSKGDETSTTSRVLNANPAALCRSLTFHESAR